MILNRPGTKFKIADKILPYFPPHKTYIELFFGAGGMYWKKTPAQVSILNDIDDDVMNLWMVYQNHREELLQQMELIPPHKSIFDHYKKNAETDPIKKAVRYLMLSNFSIYSTGHTMAMDNRFAKKSIFDRAFKQFEGDVKLLCEDFRRVFEIVKPDRLSSAFVYADPPYIDTCKKYKTNFTEKDFNDLVNVLIGSGVRFAISEFDTPFILETAIKNNLTIIEIGERLNMKNRRVEILIVNYPVQTNINLFSNDL